MVQDGTGTAYAGPSSLATGIWTEMISAAIPSLSSVDKKSNHKTSAEILHLAGVGHEEGSAWVSRRSGLINENRVSVHQRSLTALLTLLDKDYLLVPCFHNHRCFQTYWKELTKIPLWWWETSTGYQKEWNRATQLSHVLKPSEDPLNGCWNNGLSPILFLLVGRGIHL